MADLTIDTNERGPLHDSVIRKAESVGLSVQKKTLVVGDYLLGNACFNRVTAAICGDNWTTWMQTMRGSSF